MMIFLSYSGDQSVEAELLQFAFEKLLVDVNCKVWTYERDQSKDEKAIAESLKSRIKASNALIFLVSESTLSEGAAQWMELAYADAFDIPTFIMLHHISYQDLKAREGGIPPLLLAAQCNSSSDWKTIANAARTCCLKRSS